MVWAKEISYIERIKEGYGKIIYENGIIYEGMLKKGLRTGDAKMNLNGVEIY